MIVAKEKLLPRLNDVVAALDDKGVDMILLLCNGDFPVFDTRCLVIEPQRLVDGCVAGLLRERHRLGVLVPVPEQENWVRRRLEVVNPNLTVAVASPYEGRKTTRSSLSALPGRRLRCHCALLYGVQPATG